MALNSILRAIWKHKSFVFHIIVITSLIVITILDSVLITKTFINDNRVTVVYTGDGKGFLAHFENITFKVSNVDSILPKEWSDELNITDLSTSTYYKEIVEKATSGELDLNSIDISTSEGKVRAASLFARLFFLDDFWLNECLNGGQKDCSKLVPDYTNLSRVLRNRTALVMLRDSLFSELRGAFAVHWPANPASITIRAIRLNDLKFEINTAEVLHNASSFVGFLRLNIKLPMLHQRQNGSDLNGVSVTVLAGRSEVELKLKPNSYNYIEVDLKNVGIYDKSKTETDCTNDPEIQVPGDNLIFHRPDCDHRGILKGIVKKCGCIPFVAAQDYRKFKSANTDLPFCNFQHYFDCIPKHGPFGGQMEKCSPSCITIRNQYTVSNKPIGQCEGGGDIMCLNVFLTLTSTDRSFVIYEERYQLTISQFLSQLGGNIGLYTGLSLLSLWQIVLVIYDRYKRYEPQPTAKGISNVMQFLIDQVKTARAFVIDSVQNAKDDRDDPESMDRRRKEADIVLRQQQPMSCSISSDNPPTVRELFDRIEQHTRRMDEIHRLVLQHSSILDALMKKQKNDSRHRIEV